MALQKKEVLLDGLKVSYLEAGEKQVKALLLLHGETGDARWHWGTAITILAENYHVLAPDLPGYGESRKLPHMRTEAMLHWIKTFMDAKGVEQAVVVGNSFGGLLARLFAAANPSYVPALVMVNGGGVPDVPPTLALLAKIPGLFGILGRMSTSPKTLDRMIHIKTLLTPEFMETARAAASGFSGLMRMLLNSPLPKKNTPLMPTLILWGAEDKYATLEDAKGIQASVPGSHIVEIADCGHLPQLEAQDVFVWQINQFVANLTRPTRQNLSGPQILKKD